MTKLLTKRKVVDLRKTGKSYSEIRKIIKVSKSSLSLWLRDIVLTNKQVAGLKMKKVRAVERYKSAMKKKRKDRLSGYYKNQIKKWIPLTEREKFLAGLFLYWGEGNKVSNNTISIANTDPDVIKFTIQWFKDCLGFLGDKIHIRLHLYSDMNIKLETEYWSKVLNIESSQFSKPYIKKSLVAKISQKGFGHGTCTVSVFKTVEKENIMMAIRAISDYYEKG
ncbi:MAG TPA: hypothetical protein VFI61_04395 [Patescibacteria group bacterium]|nr:hypothetical protein [Patescibacteria group bacterium]